MADNNKVKSLRQNKHLSAEAASRRIGISASMWYKVEYGQRRPSVKTALRMAELLGTTVEKLFSA